MAKKILLIHGPNLNLLGSREPEKYGTTTLRDIESDAIEQALQQEAILQVFQSNHEGGLIDRIHKAKQEGIQFIIINAGAYTHTSVAIRDAFLSVSIPFVEMHITNIHKREEFRHKSYLSDIAVGVVCGLGVFGYSVSLDFALKYKQ